MVSAGTGLLVEETSSLAEERRKRVNRLLEEVVEDHRELAEGFNEMEPYRVHAGEMMNTTRRVRLCSDDRLDPAEILGQPQGTVEIIRTAGFMTDKAFITEFRSGYLIARELGKLALWIDLMHDDCVALGGDLELGHQIQDRQREMGKNLFPNAIYIAGGVQTDSYELSFRGRAGGREVVFTTDDARKSIPKQYRQENSPIEPYIIKALLDTGAFDKESLYLLAQMLKHSTFNSAEEVEDLRESHTAKFGATGLGMGWRSGDVFVVTAHMGNEHSLRDAERSMQIGFDVIDGNTKKEDPIIWLITRTYSLSDENSAVKTAKSQALRMAEMISGLDSLQPWFKTNRVVLIPALVERESSYLIPVDEMV